jgi:citrate synthase
MYVVEQENAVAESGDAEKWVSDALGRGERIMGFGHRVYRAEDPRSRVLKRIAEELGSPRVAVAEELEQVAHEAIAKKSEGHSWTNVEYWSAVVLDVADVPPSLAPAMFACSRTAGWSAHILEQKRLGVLVRPSAKYVGPGARSLQGVG